MTKCHILEPFVLVCSKTLFKWSTGPVRKNPHEKLSAQRNVVTIETYVRICFTLRQILTAIVTFGCSWLEIQIWKWDG